MTALIDFDKEYMLFAARKLKVNSEINDNELTELLNKTMEEWLSTKADFLDGKTPDEYFAEMTAEESVNLLNEYSVAGMDIPEPLFKHLSASGNCISVLKQLVCNVSAAVAARASALTILSGMKDVDITDICIEALVEENELTEIAAEWLKSAGYKVIEPITEKLNGMNQSAKATAIDVLSCYPGIDATADILIERLYNDRDRRALYAALAGKFGDERLLEPLMRLSQLTDMEYYDYKEIVNAIEMLGGEIGEEREFYGDPDYEALRVAETLPVDEEQ